MFARWLNLLAGLWLFVSPWILGYAQPAARANDFWVGIAVAAVALVAMGVREFRFINTGLGAWLVMAPFILNYGRFAAVGNDVVVGLCVLALSLVPSYVRGVGRREPVLP